MRHYVPLLDARALRRELEDAERASTVELPKELFRAHIIQALVAADASGQGAHQLQHPLVSANELRRLWSLHAMDEVVPMDCDKFRDLVMQALAAIDALDEQPRVTLH